MASIKCNPPPQELLTFCKTFYCQEQETKAFYHAAHKSCITGKQMDLKEKSWKWYMFSDTTERI